MGRRATARGGIAGLTILLAACASSTADPQTVDPTTTPPPPASTTTTAPPPTTTQPVEDADPRYLDAWVESFAEDVGFPVADARCAFSRLAETPIFADTFDEYLPGEATFDDGLDAETSELVVAALTECGFARHIGGLMATEMGISTEAGVCVTEGLFALTPFREAMHQSMISGLEGDAVDIGAELPVDEIAPSLVTLIKDCGLARELGVDLAAEMGVSAESGACVMEGLFELASYREVLTHLLVAALAGVEPEVGSEIAAAEEIGPSLITLIGDCGVARELGVALAGEMGISAESGACVMDRLFELEAYRELMQQGLIVGITGEELDVTNDLASADLEAAFVEAASDCLTPDEAVAVGLAPPEAIPSEIAGHAWVPSGLMAEVAPLVAGYGGHSWALAAYGEGLSYRLVISLDGPGTTGATGVDELRQSIPAEALFLIEGGFAIYEDDVVSEQQANLSVVCGPGFTGDDLETGVAALAYEADPDSAFEIGIAKAMCFFEGDVLGFIVSDNLDEIDELIDVTVEMAQESAAASP